MFLITSAAFVSSGLATEYGKIPPAFLPLQNRRLFEHQLKLCNDNETKVVSLPLGFQISSRDMILLEQKSVLVVFVPIGLSLGQSIVYVLNVTARYNEPLKVLHGDTLFAQLPNVLDAYLVAKASDNYAWAVSESSVDEEFVYAGFFSFSNQSQLIKSITESNYDFVDGILRYKQEITVEEIRSDNWLDFGHANTYYRSKTHLTTQRFFNNLKIDGFSVRKESADKLKMKAESNWFDKLPVELKRYIPALWSQGETEDKGYYQIEYFYLSSLAELFVYGNNEYFIWQNILSACNQFLIDCLHYIAPNELNIVEQAKRLYGEKTKTRLRKFSKLREIDLNHEWIFNGIKIPSIKEIEAEMNVYISAPSLEHQTIIHGDFCFSNILYDFRTKSIKVIDPRGVDVEGNLTIYGDVRYDIAKLAHSVIGLYDLIIGGYFSYSEKEKYNIEFEIYSNKTIEKIQHFFVNSTFAGMTLKESSTYPILVHLFLSMLPLHNDNPQRQKAMLANAFRLYIEFKNQSN